MNFNLQYVKDRCLKEGLNINLSKTVVVPFIRKKNSDSLSRLRLRNSQLEVSGTVKYLGLTLDSNLAWNDHLNNALHKAKWTLRRHIRFTSLMDKGEPEDSPSKT